MTALAGTPLCLPEAHHSYGTTTAFVVERWALLQTTMTQVHTTDASSQSITRLDGESRRRPRPPGHAVMTGQPAAPTVTAFAPHTFPNTREHVPTHSASGNLTSGYGGFPFSPVPMVTRYAS